MCNLTGFWQSVGCAAKNDSAAWQPRECAVPFMASEQDLAG